MQLCGAKARRSTENENAKVEPSMTKNQGSRMNGNPDGSDKALQSSVLNPCWPPDVKSRRNARKSAAKKSAARSSRSVHNWEMKSAYEIAMERLNKTAPAARLTGKQKEQLAELDSRYTAKIAEREIALNGELAKAAGDFEKEKSLREQLVHERKKLQAELEDKKELVRRGSTA
jgi:hypothetical protein